MRIVLITIISALFASSSYSQGITISPSISLGKAYKKVLAIREDQEFVRQIQFVRSGLLEIGYKVKPKLNIGVTGAIAQGNFNRVIATSGYGTPLVLFSYYSLGAYAQQVICNSCSLKWYLSADSGVLFNFPTRADNYVMEVDNQFYWEAAVGGTFIRRRHLNFFAEVGYGYTRIYTKVGVTFFTRKQLTPSK